MRNKRWHIRRALVADLRTDPMIANSRGRTVGRRALSRRVSKHQIRTPQVSRLAPTPPTHCAVCCAPQQPPGMQLRESFPRVLLALSCAVLGVLKQAGSLVFVMIGVLCLAAGTGYYYYF